MEKSQSFGKPKELGNTLKLFACPRNFNAIDNPKSLKCDKNIVKSF